MALSPETVVATRPRILSDEVARNSILGFWTLSGISTLSALALTPRTWSAIRQAIRARARSESSFVPGNAMNALGRYRVLCLYLASVLLLLESINSLIYYRNLWIWRDGNAVAMNVIRTFTLYPAGPLLVAATGFRISLLLGIQPQLRTKLFLALVGITTTVAAIGMITNVVAIVLNAEVAKDLVAWQSVVMFPSWMAPLLAIIPLSIVGMTLWSLKLSFGVMSEQSDVQIMTVSTSLAAADLGSSQTSGGSSPGASGQRHSDYVHPSSLGITFKVLTLLLALYWSVYLAVIAMYRPFPMHSTAITAPITAVAVATEASFEWLVHAVVARRQQRRRRRQHRRKPKHDPASSTESTRRTSTTKSQLLQLAVSSALMVSKSGHIDVCT